MFTKSIIAAVILCCSFAFAQKSENAGLIATAPDFSQQNPKGVVVKFTATPPSDKFVNFHWWFGDKLESNEQNTSHIYVAPGNYLVHLRMATADYRQQASAEVTVKINPPVEIKVPNEGEPNQ